MVRRTVSGSEVPRAPVYQDVLMDELADEWSIETEGDTVRIWFTARATPAELDGAWPR